MRIAVALYGLTTGGAPRRVMTLVAGFAARRHAVDLLVVDPEAPLTPELDPAVRLVPLDPPLPGALVPKRRRRRAAWSFLPLARHLRRERPDVLLSGASHMNLVCLAASALAGWRVPLVLRASNHLGGSHGEGTGGGVRARPWRRRLAAACYGRADAIVAVSGDVAADLRRRVGIAADRIAAVPNPIWTPALAARAAEPLDHPWLAAGEPPVVLAAGRLAKQKDFATLLRAFALLRRGGRRARLVLLGEGRERRRLEGLAAELGVADDLLIPGYEPNPPRWMARTALLAHSSRYEGMSAVLVEALAAGCPVVATRCPGGSAEVLGDGEFGRLVPPGDPAAMAEAIRATLDEGRPDPARLRRRAALFGEDAALERYLAVLGDAVERRRAGQASSRVASPAARRATPPSSR